MLVLVVDSMQRCSHPQADEGHQVREGCLQRTCKHGTWRSSLVSNQCCYEREAYSINTTISSSMSEDGCAKTAIDCVEETPGNAKAVLSVKNYCEDYATKDQVEEIKKILAEQIETGSGCQGEKIEAKVHTEVPKVLLIGPSSVSYGKSEVLSLPDLTPLDCNIPVFPDGEYYDYVGRSTSDGVLMCGGWIGGKNYHITSSCYLLTRSGYETMPGLQYKRRDATSVVTPLGLWVTGGSDEDQYHETTEIWSNNRSMPHVRLPKGMSGSGHCMVSLNKTHILLTGGRKGYHPSSASFIYNEEEGFTRIEDMKTRRKDHGCSIINDSTVLVAGGSGDDGPLSSSEYLDLTSLTWSPGPELPQTEWSVQMLGPEELGPEIGGHLLIVGYDIFKLEEEGLAQTRHWIHKKNSNHDYEWAFVVNQNMFC